MAGLFGGTTPAAGPGSKDADRPTGGLGGPGPDPHAP
jgi:hypothetical protein